MNNEALIKIILNQQEIINNLNKEVNKLVNYLDAIVCKDDYDDNDDNE